MATTKTAPVPGTEMGRCQGCGTLIPFNNGLLTTRGNRSYAMTECECGTQNLKAPRSKHVRKLP